MPSMSFNPEAKELFTKHLKGSNALTPYVLGYGVVGEFVYEFSEGKDMEGKPPYGITVLERGTGHHRCDLSSCFWSHADADSHLETLR